MSTRKNTLRTVRMTCTLNFMPDEKLRERINHLLVNNDYDFIKVVYAQISQDSIGVAVFSPRQLWFDQWEKTFEKLWGIKLDNTMTAMRITAAHKVIQNSPMVQTVHTYGFMSPSAVAGMSFASVVSERNALEESPLFVQVKVARTDSIESPGAAVAAVETKPEEPIPAPVPVPVEVPVKSHVTAFTVDKERALKKAREFMTSKSCVSKFKDFSMIPVDEYLPNYITRKKDAMNVRDSPVELCIKAFIPEVMKTSRTSNFELIIGALSDEDHKKTLANLRKYYLSGMHISYPWPYSEEFVYSFDKLTVGKCSIFEVQRRIMALEALVAKLTKYTYEVMNKKPNVGSLSKPVVQKTGLVIASGSGLLGIGENFWALNDKMKTARASENFTSAMEAQPEFGNCVKYLMENRASAMTRTGLIAAGELAWGIPLLSFIVEARTLVWDLADKDSAVELWGRVQSFEEVRKKVRVSDLIPMIKYGETLTAYCKSLQEICKALKPIGNQNKIPFPVGIDMAVLNSSGHIVGPSGEGLKYGHLEATAKPVIIPFPAIPKDISVETPDTIKEKFKAYFVGEAASIQSMLGVLEIEGGPALQMMRLERDNIKRILNTDSHTANRTHVLPPTASLPMPLANYMPLKIYEMH